VHAEQVAGERLERVPGGPDSWGVTVGAGTLASRRSAGQPVVVLLGSEGADADESVSAAMRGVEAAAERTGTMIVRGGGRSTGISSATSSRASSLDRWKNRGSTSVRFSGVRTFAISKMVERQRRPFLSGSMTSGMRWISAAAVAR
jgi:hypothetical protein